jgi:hypothetical protein
LAAFGALSLAAWFFSESLLDFLTRPLVRFNETPLYFNDRGRCISTWTSPFNDEVKTHQRMQIRVLRNETLLVRLDDVLLFVRPNDLHRVSQTALILPHYGVSLEQLIEMKDGSLMAIKPLDDDSFSLLRWNGFPSIQL